MKTLIITLLALLPLAGFSQTSGTVPAKRSVQQAPAQHIEKAPAVQVQETPAVLTEEEMHAQWLRNNPHYLTMPVAERNKRISELEEKLSSAPHSPGAIALQREIKWISQTGTGK